MAAYPSLPISNLIEEEVKDYQILSTGYEMGYVQTRARTTIAPLRLTIAHVGLTFSQVQTWKSFWDSALGGAQSFTFTDPRDYTVHTMRFKVDQQRPAITVMDGTSGYYRIEQIRLEEAL